MAIAGARSTPGVVESYLYFLGILVAAILAANRALNPATGSGMGIVLAWGVLGLFTAIIAPGFSYLFTWPAMAGAVAVAGWNQSGATASWVRFLLVAIPTLVLMTPAIDIFFQFALPRPGNPDSELTFMVAVPVMLSLLAAGLLQSVRPHPAPSIRETSAAR
jgi:hypothetical protein